MQKIKFSIDEINEANKLIALFSFKSADETIKTHTDLYQEVATHYIQDTKDGEIEKETPPFTEIEKTSIRIGIASNISCICGLLKGSNLFSDKNINKIKEFLAIDLGKFGQHCYKLSYILRVMGDIGYLDQENFDRLMEKVLQYKNNDTFEKRTAFLNNNAFPAAQEINLSLVFSKAIKTSIPKTRNDLLNRMDYPKLNAINTLGLKMKNDHRQQWEAIGNWQLRAINRLGIIFKENGLDENKDENKDVVQLLVQCADKFLTRGTLDCEVIDNIFKLYIEIVKYNDPKNILKIVEGIAQNKFTFSDILKLPNTYGQLFFDYVAKFNVGTGTLSDILKLLNTSGQWFFDCVDKFNVGTGTLDNEIIANLINLYDRKIINLEIVEGIAQNKFTFSDIFKLDDYHIFCQRTITALLQGLDSDDILKRRQKSPIFYYLYDKYDSFCSFFNLLGFGDKPKNISSHSKVSTTPTITKQATKPQETKSTKVVAPAEPSATNQGNNAGNTQTTTYTTL